MSWTVPVPEEDSPDKKAFTDVLKTACDAGVLMFCSSPDNGKFTDVDYPTAYQRKSFFRVGAARDDGTVFSRAGDVRDLDFILPGVDVVRRHDSSRQRYLTQKVQDIPSETGSSVATALATGLAATIIYCIKASALSIMTDLAVKNIAGNLIFNSTDDAKTNAITQNDAKSIMKHGKMKSALLKVGEQL
jgi:hypothetical protein